MKKMIWMILVIFCLSGCDQNSSMDNALTLRSSLIESGCSFLAHITADYGDLVCDFILDCTVSSSGDLQFTVQFPESISGIGGSISAKGGSLEFDDVALAFPLLADGQLSPVSAPYILMKSLLGGYISSAGRDGELHRVTIRDSYESDALYVDVWMEGHNPVRAEILWENRRILMIRLENFEIG